MDDPRLLPVRMLNEFVYCPRLMHLELVQGEFETNEFVVEGEATHTRVDRPDAPLEAGEDAPKATRSVELSSAALGLVGKIDLVERDGGEVRPVDYKRGHAPDVPDGAYEPELVQLCAYGLLLREHGFTCSGGVLYFAASRRRVEIAFTDALVARTREAATAAQASLADGAALPAPLVGSRKCAGCSLNGICLPDETNLLLARSDEVRPLWSAKHAGLPVYVQGQGFRVGVDHERLVVKDRDAKVVASARLGDTAHVVLQGNVQISTQALAALFEADLPVVWMSYGGWLRGLGEGIGHRNIGLRQAQFRVADDVKRSLEFARQVVWNKIQNQRTLVRRGGAEDRVLRGLADLSESAKDAGSAETLLGIEGTAARTYFESLRPMLKSPLAFDFEKRTRRPPLDPVNAVLSFVSALLTKECIIACRTAGFDPFLGFYHRPRYGRPGLALDLMEVFRPLIAESTVLTVTNGSAVVAKDFVKGATGVNLTPEGRKAVLRAFERRMSEEVQHPVFGYRATYRRVLEMHARLLARWVMGELPVPPEFRTR